MHINKHVILFLILIEYIHAGRRIFQGQNAAVGAFPYVASWGSLQRTNNFANYEHICTCSILSPTWTLSAAHCMEEPPATIETYILFNSFHTRKLQANTSKVIEIFPHPRYDFTSIGVEGPLFNRFDICIIRTERIIIEQYAVLSAVDYKTLIGNEVFVTGYGTTNVSSNVNTAIKLEKPLQVYKGVISRCKENDGFKSKMFICISSPCGSLAVICGGDSGGPAIHASGVLGVHTWHTVMCHSGQEMKAIHKHSLAKSSSAVLAPVSPVLDWISSTIASVA